MSGRAGRRGFDTEGYCIPIVKKEILLNIYNAKPIPNEVEINEDISTINLFKICKNKESSTELFKSYIEKIDSGKKT